MRFQVIGASAESGDDVDVLIEAATQTDVEKIAHDRGILVSSITPVAAAAAHRTAVGVAHAAHGPGGTHVAAHGTRGPGGTHVPAAHGPGGSQAPAATAVAHAPAHAPKADPGAIAMIDDDPPSNGNGEHHERAHGVITTNANTPSDTAHSAEGHIAAEKHNAGAEYHIIMNQSLYLLESAVNKHLRDGWDVAGGMSVATSNNALNYFQSMVRRKKPTA